MLLLPVIVRRGQVTAERLIVPGVVLLLAPVIGQIAILRKYRKMKNLESPPTPKQLNRIRTLTSKAITFPGEPEC